MKAWVLHDVNDFKYEDIDSPVANDDEVIVNVKAVGICGSDIPRAYKTGAHKKDLVIGHEFAGQVAAVGKNCDEKLIGKKVGIFPLIPCGKCGPCKEKRYEMCRNYNYLGSRCNGGFAEQVAVPRANLIELPDAVTYEQAAMLEPMAVAVHAIRRSFLMSMAGEEGQLKKDANIAVVGLGTIGLFIVMFLRQMGYENILAVGNKDFQREQAMMLGVNADDYCDSKKTDTTKWLLEKTDNYGADLIFECVGRNETICACVDAAKPAGALLFLGNPYSDMEFDKNTYWKILRNQLKITGTWNSSFTGDENDDWHYVVNALNDGSIAPEKLISHRYPLAEIDKGFHIMRDKTEDYVKIMACL